MRLSKTQRAVVKVLKQNGYILQQPKAKSKLFDAAINPIRFVNKRTIAALIRKQKIQTKEPSIFILKPKQNVLENEQSANSTCAIEKQQPTQLSLL